MSADNWATCPQCEKNEIKRISETKRKAEEAYGKLPQEEYLKLLTDSQCPTTNKETLREDYEIGISNGVFEIQYSGSCQTCKFKFSYSFKTPTL